MSETVFRHYDRAGLDREYDNRGKVAAFPRYLERYRQQSEQARARLQPRLNVCYGPSPAETLDLFPAAATGAGREPAPVNVFIHGGYWKALSKHEFSFVAAGLTAHGVLTVVIDYALIPAVTMDELVRQCRAALAWTWRNAAGFGGDPHRLYVSGHSAGGHLTAMMLATDWPAFAPDLPADLLKGGCGISGLYDLEPIRLCFLNDDLRLDRATAERNSPVRLPCRAPEASLLLPVGALEGDEYARQSRALADAWRGSVRNDGAQLLSGQDHFSIVDQLGEADAPLTSMIARQCGNA